MSDYPIKDKNGFFVKREPPPDPPISDISIDRLIESSLLILYREVRNLTSLSSQGKLDPADARDLRDITKLLFELKDRESESLKSITDEQLQAQAKALLNDSK